MLPILVREALLLRAAKLHKSCMSGQLQAAGLV